jgi:antitoxin VapB
MLFPLVAIHEIEIGDANRCLKEWGHKMGPLGRPRNYSPSWCHGMFHNGQLVAVTTASGLIRERVGGLPDWLKDELTRETTVELSRLCAARPHLNRAMLRIWREFIFPELPYRFAVSYQDACLHSGDTYRFDGWQRVGFSHSGTDRRTNRKGRDKWVWLWPRVAEPQATERAEACVRS